MPTMQRPRNDLSARQTAKVTTPKKPRDIEPIDVSKTCWLYSEAAGLCVVQEKRLDNGELLTTVMETIPWKTIDRAIAAKPKE